MPTIQEIQEILGTDEDYKIGKLVSKLISKFQFSCNPQELKQITLQQFLAYCQRDDPSATEKDVEDLLQQNCKLLDATSTVMCESRAIHLNRRKLRSLADQFEDIYNLTIELATPDFLQKLLIIRNRYFNAGMDTRNLKRIFCPKSTSNPHRDRGGGDFDFAIDQDQENRNPGRMDINLDLTSTVDLDYLPTSPEPEPDEDSQASEDQDDHEDSQDDPVHRTPAPITSSSKPTQPQPQAPTQVADSGSDRDSDSDSKLKSGESSSSSEKCEIETRTSCDRDHDHIIPLPPLALSLGSQEKEGRPWTASIIPQKLNTRKEKETVIGQGQSSISKENPNPNPEPDDPEIKSTKEKCQSITINILLDLDSITVTDIVDAMLTKVPNAFIKMSTRVQGEKSFLEVIYNRDAIFAHLQK